MRSPHAANLPRFSTLLARVKKVQKASLIAGALAAAIFAVAIFIDQTQVNPATIRS